MSLASFAVGLFVPFFAWFFVVVGVLLIVFVKRSETASLVVADRDGKVDLSATRPVDDDLRGILPGHEPMLGVLVPSAVVSVELPRSAASEKLSPLFLLAMFVALGSGVLVPFILTGIVVWKIFT